MFGKWKPSPKRGGLGGWGWVWGFGDGTAKGLGGAKFECWKRRLSTQSTSATSKHIAERDLYLNTKTWILFPCLWTAANYLNKTCNSNLRSCIEAFKNSGNATFAGANCSASDVETVAITAMDIATGSTGFSPPMPLSFGWVTLSVCGLSVLLLLWPSLMVNQFRSWTK